MRPNEYTMNVHVKHTIAGCVCSTERPGCQKPASATKSILWEVLRKPCAWHAGPATHSARSEAGCPAAGKSECPELFCVLFLAPLASLNTPACLLLPLPPGQVGAPAPFPAPLDRAASPVDIHRTIFHHPEACSRGRKFIVVKLWLDLQHHSICVHYNL